MRFFSRQSENVSAERNKEEQRKFQRILWRFSEDDPISIFNLNTVTYGIYPSAYQALRCLKQLSLEEGKRFALVSDYPMENIYVYEVFFGADTIQEANNHASQFCEFLVEGGFPLRKWAANHPDLLSELHVEWLAEEPINDSLLSKNHPLRGLIWNSENEKYPFILLAKSHFSTLVARSYHL